MWEIISPQLCRLETPGLYSHKNLELMTCKYKNPLTLASNTINQKRMMSSPLCTAAVRFTALVFVLSLLSYPSMAQSDKIGYYPRMLRGNNDQTCASTDLRETVRSRITRDVHNLLQSYNTNKCHVGRYEDFPVNSCADIPANCPSDYYWVGVTGSEEPRRVYCTTNTQCCHGNEGKWMRIGYLNMTDPDQQCPRRWREVVDPIRSCRREHTQFSNNVFYSSMGTNFTRVCGRVIAYQYGTPEAFSPGLNIDGRYVDGVSITYGNPRQHIWTFAAAAPHVRCLCNALSNNQGRPSPPFVNDEYFCELGSSSFIEGHFFPDNLLWDGQGCSGGSTCCSLNNPPWFCKEMLEPTREDVELRILTAAYNATYLENEDTPIELIEIYVQ